MKIRKLHQLWRVIENTRPEILLNYEAEKLSVFLLEQLTVKVPLSMEENIVIDTYINSKIALIRDLANERQQQGIC